MILQIMKVLLDLHLAIVILLKKKGVIILKLHQVADRNEVHGSNICIRGSLIHLNSIEKQVLSSKPIFELTLSILIAHASKYCFCITCIAHASA